MCPKNTRLRLVLFSWPLWLVLWGLGGVVGCEGSTFLSGGDGGGEQDGFGPGQDDLPLGTGDGGFGPFQPGRNPDRQPSPCQPGDDAGPDGCDTELVDDNDDGTGWLPGRWTACSVSCGSGTQDRTVQCVGIYGQDVLSEECAADSKPATSRVCQDTTSCGWFVGAWGACNALCGEGSQARTVECRAPSGAPIEPDWCTAARPEASRACTGSGLAADVCGNGIDDDCDGFRDCADSDCFFKEACFPQDTGGGEDPQTSGTAVYRVNWGSKDEIGPAYCNEGDYAMGQEGWGITTGEKRNFGALACARPPVPLPRDVCYWREWGSKGRLDPRCDPGDYVAGHEGLGVTTGDKRNFGRIFCCGSNKARLQQTHCYERVYGSKGEGEPGGTRCDGMDYMVGQEGLGVTIEEKRNFGVITCCRPLPPDRG